MAPTPLELRKDNFKEYVKDYQHELSVTLVQLSRAKLYRRHDHAAIEWSSPASPFITKVTVKSIHIFASSLGFPLRSYKSISGDQRLLLSLVLCDDRYSFAAALSYISHGEQYMFS